MSSVKKGRRRGVILSLQGLRKLQVARTTVEHQDNYGDRYTYEDLNGRTGLSLNTVIKILQAEIPVDRQSLHAFFAVFNLGSLQK
jgi:hypothetical protein